MNRKVAKLNLLLRLKPLKHLYNTLRAMNLLPGFWVNKYAVKDSFGNIYEKSPEDMALAYCQ